VWVVERRYFPDGQDLGKLEVARPNSSMAMVDGSGRFCCGPVWQEVGKENALRIREDQNWGRRLGKVRKMRKEAAQQAEARPLTKGLD